MDKLLKLYTYVDGGINDTPFPDTDNQIEIGAFRYDAKRMGGAPTITASVNYPTCLDDEWTDNVYAEFNGEKYYLKQTPTSSYNNESTMYKHDLELVSERSILDNVYFFDTVVGEPEGDDKPVSNSTKAVFFGNIDEFVSRLNSSLQYSGLDYTVVVEDDDNITKEEKLMSFEDQFFSNVLQEIYNTYEVPYYFEGKTIHIGFSNSDAVVPTFSYGVDNALLSITKNNANYKIVNRVTATGSSDNIPFYYPNNSPKGDIEATTNREGLSVRIVDHERFSNEIGIDESLVYLGAPLVTIDKVVHKNGGNIPSGGSNNVSCGYLGFTDEYKMYIDAVKATEITLSLVPEASIGEYDGTSWSAASFTSTTRIFLRGKQILDYGEGYVINVEEGENIVEVYIEYKFDYSSIKNTFVGGAGIEYSISPTNTNYWTFQDRKVDLSDFGLLIEEGSSPQDGDTITQTLVKYVKTSQNLMPSIYRETDGAERFYNAVNYPYPKPEGFDDTLLNGYYGEDGILRNPLGEYEVEGYIHNDAYKNEDGTYIHFNAPYVEGRPKEHIITVEDIKPTIKGTEVNGLRIDMFSEFAYDEDDNDETYEDEEGNVYFKHPYFYGKLRVMDFNLFDHAIEQQPMTISFTSGHCGACNFEIGVTEDYPQKNPVQVDEYGNLVRDENGMVLAGVEGTQQLVTTFQERQQDTSKYEVWIALRKEEETYGILMPQVAHRPKEAGSGNEGDTFVILGINLPQSYIINAEKKLEAEIIKYLQDNNDEKFTFSIGFSRIYFEENNILDQLSENSKIAIMYNGQRYDLYVSSFSYSMSEGDVLPEIRVELDETLKVSQNALQNAISQIKSELGRAIANIDVVGAATPYFIRKDTDDEARGKINFTKGIKFGEGGKVEVMDNNSAKLTIEYLEVTKKASFTSLEIQEKTHVGGQMLITPAAINCGEVEELNDVYRCYFQTKGADGDEIFNQFAVGDQAICQTYNAWGSKYYWRLVTGVGEDYIDLSKTQCEEGSGIPQAGDKIIQLGNQSDIARQNAIVIAAYGDGSPYIIQYKGINSFELGSDKVVTKLSSTENIFTGKVHMELGSDGLDQLPEWIEVRDTANEALEKAGSIGEEALGELEAYIDSVREELQEQIDGAIDSYFEDYEPTTSNFPAKDWTTEAEKESHLNDTFTNLSDGRSWRWSKVAGSYAWVEIADTATSEALKLAGQAKASADGKIRMFVDEPYTPYSVGDLWSRGEDAPLMICVKDKETGAFDEADWSIADDAHAYVDETIENIKVGGQNLLRNSGFTGDYLSEQLADESVLDAAEELYSSPFDHWTVSNANVVNSNDTVSGKAAFLNSGEISQSLYYKTEANAEYVLSFKAQGSGSVNIELAGSTTKVDISPDINAIITKWRQFEVVINVAASSDVFRIYNTGASTIGNLKLEKGNKATSWSPSPLDNASDRAYYQSLKYIQNAFEGATDIDGGLVLTELIQVGDFDKEQKKWEKMTAGMSGVYESDNDVAFWAGGDLKHAIETVMRYEDNPAYQPTEAELATMAKFVVTHGGRAILNDIILRGLVYATGGKFAGEIEAQGGKIGLLEIGVNPETQEAQLSSRDYCHLGRSNTVSFTNDGFNAHSAYNETEGVCTTGYVASMSGMGFKSSRSYRRGLLETDEGEHADFLVEHNVDNFDGSETSFKSNSGMFAGLRPMSKVVTTTVARLSEFDHSVLFSQTSGTINVYLPSNARDGQEYVLETLGVDLVIISDEDNIYSHQENNSTRLRAHTISARGVFRLKYYRSANTWTICRVDSY